MDRKFQKSSENRMRSNLSFLSTELVALIPYENQAIYVENDKAKASDYSQVVLVGWENYFVFPSNLRYLSIAGCFLTEEMVLSIARLKKLENLTLKGGFPWYRREYRCWDVTDVEFPALKYLALHGVRIEEWKASEESFPVFEEISIRTGYFKEIPPSFTDIPTLRLIKLYDYNDSVEVSAMNIKKEIEENNGCDSLQVLKL
ncbi:hypothetical protein FXO38_23684 [Capsicum annuum]|uniref:Uncharacterized protein n=1 Tax=Capsicum annuum TaxID=4072 RepID=A0A2G3AJW0_CAPAN|nr:hypothetical protein FXO38_23684 [Capsicum annuum]KAF3647397.1 hypothetical protein FXO37_20010 [Capsicum annuum]PHT94468.1 hypothetical protein T459_02350 [Capsicum annuum]